MPPVETGAIERAVRSSAGALTGLAVHELSNRLAVMRETVGLLEDLAGAGRSGAAGTARAHASLDDQVGRAMNVVRALATLGAGLGAGDAGFEPGALLEDLLALTERWARQRALHVERDLPAGLGRVGGEPALFLCLVHRLLARAGEAQAPGGSIAVRAAGAGGRVRVSLRAPAPPPAWDDDIDRELARRLGGELLREGGGELTIVLAPVR